MWYGKFPRNLVWMVTVLAPEAKTRSGRRAPVAGHADSGIHQAPKPEPAITAARTAQQDMPAPPASDTLAPGTAPAAPAGTGTGQPKQPRKRKRKRRAPRRKK